MTHDEKLRLFCFCGEDPSSIPNTIYPVGKYGFCYCTPGPDHKKDGIMFVSCNLWLMVRVVVVVESRG